MKYIDKKTCRDFDQTGYKWLIDCLTGNEAKCHQMFRMKTHFFLQLCNVLGENTLLVPKVYPECAIGPSSLKQAQLVP